MDKTNLWKGNSSIMNIFFLNTLSQTEKTENPQLINGKFYSWIVKTERFKDGETLRDFLIRTESYLNNRHVNFDAIGVYDISAFPIINGNASMMISYAVLKDSQ